LVSFAVLITLRYLEKPELLGFAGIIMMLGMAIYWICGIKKISMSENGVVGGKLISVPRLSVIYKVLVFAFVILRYLGSFGGNQTLLDVYCIVAIVERIVFFLYAVTCVAKEANKEFVIALIYDLYAELLVPCSMIPLGTAF